MSESTRVSESGGSGGNHGANARRLFLGSCVALIATSVAFATVGAVMFALKGEFGLNNAQVGWIGGAALDVMEQEPPVVDNPLLDMHNVLLTAHTASFSVESLVDNRRNAVAEMTRVFIDRRWPVALINPTVKGTARLRSVVTED